MTKESSPISLNINRLLHHSDFDLSTGSLGTIRCGPLDLRKKLAEFELHMPDNTFDGVELARELLLSCARKLTGNEKVDENCGGQVLSGGEVNALLKDELDDFCDKFIAKRLQRALPAGSDTNVLDTGEPGSERIARALWDFADAERTASQELKKRIEELARGPSSFAFEMNQISKRNLTAPGFTANTLESIRQNDMFSGRLGESIAALRAPQIPTNPVHKTNEALEAMLGNIEQLRPVLVDCATLIQSMNSTALQMQADAIKGSENSALQSKRAMWVAIGSIIISIFVGAVSIRYAQLSPTAEQADKLVDRLEKQIGALATAGKDDRVALIKAFSSADRASTHKGK